MKSSTIVANFNSSIEQVWDVVTNNNVFDWRSDLSKIKVIDNNRFDEYTKDGFKTEFTITLKEDMKRYEFDMNNKNMTGHWTGIFTKAGKGTKIEFTEDVCVSNPIMKLFVGIFLKKQQATYVSDLRKALGE